MDIAEPLREMEEIEDNYPFDEDTPINEIGDTTRDYNAIEAEFRLMQ